MQATKTSDFRRIDPAEAADLRRRRRSDLAELIVDRSAWLMPEDRALVCAVYRDGLTAAEVAKLRGEPARHVRRRLRRLVLRVLSKRYEFVMRRREQWPPTRRRVATVCVLQGRTMRETASHLRLSLHTVRGQMAAVAALEEAQAA